MSGNKKRDDPSGTSLEVTFLNTKADQSIGLVFGRPLRTFWPGFQRPSSVSMLMRSYLLRTFLFFRILPEAFKLGCLDMLSTPVVKLSFKTHNILPLKEKSNNLSSFFLKISLFFALFLFFSVSKQIFMGVLLFLHGYNGR